jgi:hypothetical protein
MDALVRRKKGQQTLADLDGSDLVLDPAAAAELTQAAVGDGGSVLLAQAQVVPESSATVDATGSATASSAAPAAAGVGAGMGWIGAAAVGLAALSASSKTSTNTAQTRSGSVIDGYLSGATVFIDVNGDGQLGDGEPSTVSDD